MTAILVCLMAMLGLQLLTPYWWWVMIVPFAYGAAAARSGGKAVRTGFFAAGLLWLGSSLFFYLTGSGLIAMRMARMFGLGRSWLMVPVTALVAAVAAGISGYAGYAV
ncbi:MAG: hypothetical protein NT147_03020, partial [Candidatus Aminicenantes bacterium]|nr:hypothetical protein [Candidatus Aminicenantes bacterium]